jgi:hypothetical protein
MWRGGDAEPVFNLNAVQTTTHPVAPLLVVSGPYAKQIGGAGCFGSGGNATVGRRPILLNIGGRGQTPRHGDARKPGKVLLCDCRE